MIVILESSAISKLYARNANYEALTRLASINVIDIHIPYIVKREIETQRIDGFIKEFENSVSSLKKLRKKSFSEEVNTVLENLESSKNTLIENVKKNTNEYFANLKPNHHEIDKEQTIKAIEAYFNGTYPLKIAKDRQDIPDSFVCREIEDIQNKNPNDQVVLIANDNKIIDTFKENEKIEIFGTVDEFIRNDSIQLELSKINTFDQIHEQPLEFIKKYEKSTNHLKDILSEAIGEFIVGKSIFDQTILDDNNEAVINSYNTASEIEIDYENMFSYGDNQFGLKFTAKLFVTAEFFIFKADYYSQDSDFHIEDWNDHYYLAEDEYEIETNGTFSLKIDLSNEILKDSIGEETEEFEKILSDVYCSSEVKVESIEDIYLI